MSEELKNFVKNGRKIYGAAFNFRNPNDKASVQLEHPVLFFKSPSDYITEGTPIEIPRDYTVNQEIELGILIGKKCKNVSESEALLYVGGYCVGLDMTATHEFSKIQSNGWPWTFSKSFDTACPVSRFITKEEIANPDNVNLWSTINGKPQQEGSTKDLVFSVSQMVSYISQFQTLYPCDLILTGAPPTPGPVKHGDVVEAGIKNGVSIKFYVKDSE